MTTAYKTSPTSDHFSASRTTFEMMTTHLSSGHAMALDHVELEEYVTGEEGRGLLRQLLQDALDLRATREIPIAVVGNDGVQRARSRPSARQLETLVGRVSVRRLQAGAADTKESLHLADAALNLPIQMQSFPVQQRITLEAARGSYEETVASVTTTTGASVSKRQAEQIVQAAAVDFDEFYAQQKPAAVDTTDLLVITADAKGIVVRPQDLREQTRKAAAAGGHKLQKRLSKGEKRNRKRMAEVAAVYDIAPLYRTADDVMNDLRPVRVVDEQRPKPKNKRVWASIEKEMETVIAEAFDEADRHDPEGKRTWVGLVDGNKPQIAAMKAEAQRRGRHITLVLDIIHVIEYLWRAAWCLHAEGARAAEAWVHQRLDQILRGNVSHVVAGIRRSATLQRLSAKARKPVDICAHYLLSNKELLQYDAAMKAGMPIATGIIEGACRHLVKDRMDITGARWSLAGAEAVLRFRALRASGDFDDYWAFHRKRELERNHQSRYRDAIADLCKQIHPMRPLRLVSK